MYYHKYNQRELSVPSISSEKFSCRSDTVLMEPSESKVGKVLYITPIKEEKKAKNLSIS